MIKKNVIVLILLTAFSFSCSTCKTNDTKNDVMIKSNTQKSLKDFASERYGQNFKTIENSSKTFVIVLENIKIKKSPVMEKNRFFVYNIEEEKIIHEGEISNSKIFWEDEHIVRIGRVPGMIQKDNEGPSVVGGYTINVITNKKKYK